MQMSARNAFGARYVFDGRSHDRLAQRSSGFLGPSPPGNIRRSIAPSVVGTPAPHAAAPYRASGFVQWHWHFSEVLRCPLYGRYRGKSGSETDIVKLSRRTLNGHPNWSAEVAEIKISAHSMQE
jgi:hypothetical protein